MVLAYFGQPRMLSRCRVACDPGRDGITTAQLMDAAVMLGLCARDWVIQGADAFDSSTLPLPAIVYWQGRHFVIVERVTRRRVVIVDPAFGRRRLSRGDFDRDCSGVALTFTDGDDQTSRGGARVGSSGDTGNAAQGWFGSVKELLRDVRQAPDGVETMGLLIGSTVALRICGLAVPVGMLLGVDHVLTGAMEPQLFLMAVAGLLVVVSHTMLRFVRSQALAHLRMHVGARDAHRVVSRFVHLPFHVVRRRMGADLSLVGDLDALHGDVVVWTMVAGLDGWWVISTWGLVAVWSPTIAALAGGFGLLQVCLVAWVGGRMRREIESELAVDAEARACLTEMLRKLPDVKAAGREAHVMDRWSGLVGRRLAFSESRQRFGSSVEALVSGLGVCSLLGLLVLGVHEVLAGRLSLGVMLALNVLAAGAAFPLGEVTRSWLRLLIDRARCERLRGVLDLPVGSEHSSTGVVSRDAAGAESSREMDVPVVPLRVHLTGAVRVERLCFRYQRGGPLVLDDVSFAAGAGELVAIVGRAGSGKSTLARLLAGLQAPSSGRVLLDRWPLPSLDRWQARDRCGVVLQESVLFDLTIRENIAFGRGDLSFEQIVRAARVAAVHDEIMHMPLGYDTPVVGAGDGLSGSERQRLLIARAVVDRPVLLILDEAMGQLDADVERRVASNLAELSCTRIVIGHRVSMVRDADLVLVLDRGRVIEQGAPEMLMRHRGLFTRLSASGNRDCEEW